MRETDSNGSGAMSSTNHLFFRPRMWTSAARLAAVLLGVGLVLSAGPVRAQDDEGEDDRTFEQKLMDNLMSGLGAKRMEDSGINYRERSPLVVPSKIDLPRPETGKPKLAPNWPKDPDEAERKAAKEARKQKAVTPEEARMPLLPSELAARAPKGSDRTADNTSPGSNGSDKPFMMMPSELGYVGGLFSNPFSNKKKEAAKFEKEPDRDELTQPPVGYQTPSPSYAYGLGDGKLKGPKETCDASTGQCEKNWNY